MTTGKPPKNDKALDSKAVKQQKKVTPEWADGLRQIYDSVLEEPLPDSFNELLSKLDDPS